MAGTGQGAMHLAVLDDESLVLGGGVSNNNSSSSIARPASAGDVFHSASKGQPRSISDISAARSDTTPTDSRYYVSHPRSDGDGERDVLSSSLYPIPSHALAQQQQQQQDQARYIDNLLMARDSPVPLDRWVAACVRRSVPAAVV